MDASYLFLPIILTELNLVWSKALHLGEPVSFPEKTVISGGYKETEPSRQGMYYIKRGLIRLTSLSHGGQERTMLYMGPGVFFREIPMMLHSGDSLFTCMEATDTVFFSKKQINVNFIHEYPDLFFNLLESMSKKSHCFYNLLSASTLSGSFNNTCRALYSMHLHNRRKGHVVPHLTQLELAAFLGIHRSSLHKALTRLKDEGVIGSYSRNHLVIHNPDALYEYALKPTEE